MYDDLSETHTEIGSQAVAIQVMFRSFEGRIPTAQELRPVFGATATVLGALADLLEAFESRFELRAPHRDEEGAAKTWLALEGEGGTGTIASLGRIYMEHVRITNASDDGGTPSHHAWRCSQGLWCELVYCGGQSAAGGLLARLGSGAPVSRGRVAWRPEDCAWLRSGASRASELARLDAAGMKADEEECWLRDATLVTSATVPHPGTHITFLLRRRPPMTPSVIEALRTMAEVPGIKGEDRSEIDRLLGGQ